MKDPIYVRSHVARDLMQSAALFKTDKLVVWEYVSNGLQYVDVGTNPVVKVTLEGRKKLISIADNGRGMDWAGLKNFFLMHGENLDRKLGRPGRGRFGTGKSAAFGVGSTLRIRTVRCGRRSAVELKRSDIENMSSDAPIPVRELEREAPTSSPNGTVVEIEGIHLRSIDQAGIIHYVERQIARWPKSCTVYVNNHECEFSEPPISFQCRFRPNEILRATLGDVELVIKVSKKPIEEVDLRGIGIYSNGVWHETTLAGSEGREMTQYIFGEIDVPALETDNSPVPPFDMTRSMRLNAQNEVVQAIYTFIGQRIDEVRAELVTKEKERKKTEEARKLAEQASEIARVINEDFASFRHRLAKVKAKGPGRVDAVEISEPLQESQDDLLPGGDLPAQPVQTPDAHVSEGETPQGHADPREVMPQFEQAIDGSSGARKSGTDRHRLSHAKGGFQVQFKQMGAESFRAQYIQDERAIYINLDHPLLAAALRAATIDDLSFRRLAYEVAFSEYAVALASEMVAHEEYWDPSDPIVDIRGTLDRVSRRGASLYAASDN
jgi:Histidine kinase-, DNA gyrase B-, and HSP90-like ATPase